jgi:hypothetical protein
MQTATGAGISTRFDIVFARVTLNKQGNVGCKNDVMYADIQRRRLHVTSLRLPLLFLLLSAIQQHTSEPRETPTLWAARRRWRHQSTASSFDHFASFLALVILSIR